MMCGSLHPLHSYVGVHSTIYLLNAVLLVPLTKHESQTSYININSYRNKQQRAHRSHEPHEPPFRSIKLRCLTIHAAMDITSANIFPRTSIPNTFSNKWDPVASKHSNGVSRPSGGRRPSNSATIRHKKRPMAVSGDENAYKWVH